MDHPDEHTLDLYALGATSLQAAQRERLETHFASCRPCRELVELLRNVYATVGSDSNIGDADRLVRRIMPRPLVIELHPYQVLPEVPAGNHIAILAAMTGPAESKSRFENLATLASETDRVLVRLRRERKTGKLFASLHMGDVDLRAAAIITFPELDTVCVLDERGKAEFQVPQDQSPAAWSDIHAAVHFPLASFHVTQRDVHNGVTLESPTTDGSAPIHLQCRLDGDSILLHVLTQSDSSIPRRILVRADSGSSRLYDVDNGPVPISVDEAECRILLYS